MFALIQSYDDSILSALVASRAEMVTAVMETISFLGEWYILLPVAGVIVFLLWRRGLVTQAMGLAYAVVGTAIAVTLIKILVARPRPPEYLRLVAETGYSFPSWHAAIAIVFWGYLAYFAITRVKSAPIRLLVFTMCTLLICVTDFSRLYLGVHYFSDVIAGTLLGGLVLLFSIRGRGQTHSTRVAPLVKKWY